MAVELDRYLNTDELMFSNFSEADLCSNENFGAPTVQEQALSAILEVVTAAPTTPMSQYVRASTPQGGVQEWWARMISGSVNNTSSTTSCPSIGESL
jgi:hypothetical protein